MLGQFLMLLSDNCLVKITDNNDATVFDISETFSIKEQPVLTILSPKMEVKKWKVGQSENNYHGLHQKLKISRLDYSIDNGSNWINVISSTSASTGSYTWTVPNTISSACLVRLTSTTDQQVSDISDSVFEIDIQPSLTLKSPNGGERWQTETIQQITWESINVDNIIIESSNDNGESWIIISSREEAANETYDWTVPNNISSQCLVRITDVSNSEINDVE